MADVASAFNDWSTVVGNNSPSGDTTVGAGLDDNLRQIQATVKTALGHIVSAKDFGSNLASTPAADINLAIDEVNSAGGGKVIVPGDLTVETAILQKSNVELVIYGTLTVNHVGAIIKNASSVSVLSISGITNAGRVATATTSTAHGYAVGDWVHIYGASPDGYNGWHKVITVPLSTTFTFYVDKNIAADSGTISVYKAVDSNLRISGGGKLVGTASNTYGVHYHGVKDFSIDTITVDATQNHGVFIESAVDGKLFRVNGNNIRASTHNGILLGTTDRYVENIELVLCEGNACGQDGILYERGRNIRGFGNGGKYNGLCAIKIGKCDGVREVGSWGRYNTAHGLQIQPSGTGSRNVTVAHGDFCENAESGIMVGNSDTTNTFYNVALLHNQCHRNGQVASSTAYGIAFEVTASATVDRVTIEGNHCDAQTRGISVSNDGTVSNLKIRGNSCLGNTVSYNFGTAIQSSTFESDIWQTFTPALKFGGASTGMTYTAQLGKFQRSGNTVNFQVSLLLSAKGSSSGVATITGLPVTSRNTSNYYAAGNVNTGQVTFTGTPMYFIAPNTSAIDLRDIATNADATALTETAFEDASIVLISGSYEAHS